MYGTKFCRTLQHLNLSKPLLHSPIPLLDTNTQPVTIVGGTPIFLVSIPCGGGTTYPYSYFTPPNMHLMPNTPLHPYSPVSVAPSFISTHIYLFGRTFPLRLEEAATVWWLQKLVSNYLVIVLFQQIRSYHNMDKQLFSLLNRFPQKTVVRYQPIWCITTHISFM